MKGYVSELFLDKFISSEQVTNLKNGDTFEDILDDNDKRYLVLSSAMWVKGHFASYRCFKRSLQSFTNFNGKKRKIANSHSLQEHSN